MYRLNFKSFLIEHFLFKFGDFILGTQVCKQLKVQREYTSLSTDALFQIQHDKLFRILEHATHTTEFYKPYLLNKYAKINIVIKDKKKNSIISL